MCTTRLGDKEIISLDNLEDKVIEIIEDFKQKLIINSKIKNEKAIIRLPSLEHSSGKWKLTDEISANKVYWAPFEGNDSDAEIVEKMTSLTFLGESLEELSNEMECCITGKLTKKKVFLAKTY